MFAIIIRVFNVSTNHIDNFFMVDGINSNDPWMAQSVMNAVMAAGDAGTMLPIDAIDEFKTNQNPRAEYGWKPGAVVNVGIKGLGEQRQKVLPFKM